MSKNLPLLCRLWQRPSAWSRSWRVVVFDSRPKPPTLDEIFWFVLSLLPQRRGRACLLPPSSRPCPPLPGHPEDQGYGLRRLRVWRQVLWKSKAAAAEPVENLSKQITTELISAEIVIHFNNSKRRIIGPKSRWHVLIHQLNLRKIYFQSRSSLKIKFLSLSPIDLVFVLHSKCNISMVDTSARSWAKSLSIS